MDENDKLKNDNESIQKVSNFISDFINNQIKSGEKVEYTDEVPNFFKKAFAMSFIKTLYDKLHRN